MLINPQTALHVGRPNLGNRESFLARVNEILDRRWLSNNGPVVQEFEKRVADLLGVKHAIAMCNATTAIEIACRALGLKGEVNFAQLHLRGHGSCLVVAGDHAGVLRYGSSDAQY